MTKARACRKKSKEKTKLMRSCVKRKLEEASISSSVSRHITSRMKRSEGKGIVNG